MNKILSLVIFLGLFLFTACDDDESPTDNNDENNSTFEYPYEAEEFTGDWTLEFNISTVELKITKINDSTLNFNVVYGENISGGNYAMMKEENESSADMDYYLYWNDGKDYCRLNLEEKVDNGFNGTYLSNVHEIGGDSFKLRKK